MKRIEKLKLPFYNPGTKVNISLPKINSGELIIEYEIPDSSYKIGDCIIIPGNYYKLREPSNDGTWYVKINSLGDDGKIFTDLSIVVWDDENGRIDGIELEENDWWGDVYDGLISIPCTEKEINALMFLGEKYKKVKENYNLNDCNINVTENWNKLIS